MLDLLETAHLSTDPMVRRALAQAYRERGDEIEARAEECAAAAIEAGNPLVLFNIGSAYYMNGLEDAASRWYRVALALDPDMAVAHQNLACILWDRGERQLALAHRDRAYRQQCVFTHLGAAGQRRRVLLLAASGYGNVPVKHLLPQDRNALTMWFLEYDRPGTALPPFDVAFNTVGDPDLDGPTYDLACRFAACSGHRLLNHPDAVARTRRDRLPALLAGIPGVHTPPVWRTANPAAWTGDLPVLVRPAASHGGDGLRLVERADDLPGYDGGFWYLSPFRDFRSADGWWRKYRMIFVDREPLPYHLAISPMWLVHYATAGMEDEAKRAEELRFLQDPAAALGEPAMAALRQIGRRLDLDYAGIDFALLPDGGVLVFEANATMLIHPETRPEFLYKNPFVQRIVAAFDRHLAGEPAAMDVTVEELNPSG